MLRNKRFDEAKGILILLVVFGHLIEPQISNSLPVRRVYEFIYLFHMPAFVFISGYLFKIESETRTHCVRIIQNLVMPLVMFEAIYEGYTILTTGRPSVYFLDFAPYWTLWYLLSLIFWSIALPLVQTLRALISIPIFIALALVKKSRRSDILQFFHHLIHALARPFMQEFHCPECQHRLFSTPNPKRQF